MSGYATDEDSARIHGEDIVNVHLFRMNEIKELLEQEDVQNFAGV